MEKLPVYQNFDLLIRKPIYIILKLSASALRKLKKFVTKN